MSEDRIYQDADIVWVKLGSSWWPGEVCGHKRQPEGFLQQAKRKPYCVVKFFQEDSFEYVKSSKHVLPFNCSKKDEFIRKGHELFKAKKKFMEKFPSDVSTAERLTRSVTRSTLFFNSRPDSIVKAIIGDSPAQSEHVQNGKRYDNVTKIINITPSRNPVPGPASSSPPTYTCSMCDFKSNRQNVMVLHRKSHSGNAVTPVRISSTNNSVVASPSDEKVENKYVTSDPPESPLVQIIKNNHRVSETTNARKLYEFSLKSDRSLEFTADKEATEKRITEISTTRQSGTISPENDRSKTNSTPDVSLTPLSITDNYDKAKSEKIQKSLLADWIDEEKDDEEEGESIEKGGISKELPTKAEACAFETTDLHVSPITTTFSPVSQSNHIELSEPSVTSVVPSSSKLSSKIRNIPKKDRRNIIFTDENDDSGEISRSDEKNIKQFNIDHTAEVPEVTDTVTQSVLSSKDYMLTISKTATQEVTEESEPEPIDASIQLSQVTSSDIKEQTSESIPTELQGNNAIAHELPLGQIEPVETLTSQTLDDLETQQDKLVAPEIPIVKEPTIPINQIEEVPIVEQPSTEALHIVDSICETPRKISTDDLEHAIEHSVNETLPVKIPLEIIPIPYIESSNDACSKQSIEEHSSVVYSTDEAEIQINSKQDEEQIDASKESMEASSTTQATIDSVESDDVPLLPSSKKICENTTLNGTFTNEPPEKDSAAAIISTELQSIQTDIVPPDLHPISTPEPIPTETTVPNNTNSYKASLSCFDFQEEEDTDILTSIAKFKKKYISPEKNNEPSKESEVDSKKLDLEMKDKQLAEDIESLLKSTSIPAEIAKTSFGAEKSISNEVRGLPIKERGKRIFKSRNRYRAESCSSIPTSSKEKTKAQHSVLKNKDEKYESSSVEKLDCKSKIDSVEDAHPSTDNPVESFVEENVSQVIKTKEQASDDNVVESIVREDLSQVTETKEQASDDIVIESFATENLSQQVTETKEQAGGDIAIESFASENLSQQVTETKEQASDDNVNLSKQEREGNVVSSEEEIVGRITFTTAEVYAPESENVLVESLVNQDNYMSSSNPEISTTTVEESHGEEQVINDSMNRIEEEEKCPSPIGNSEQADTSTNNQTAETIESSELTKSDTDGATDIHNENQMYLEQQVEPANAYFVVESTEPIYEVEVYDGGVDAKADDSSYEINNEYDLITTEVTSIVERIITSDEITDSAEVSKNNTSSGKMVAIASTESNSKPDIETESTDITTNEARSIENTNDISVLQNSETTKPDDAVVHSDEISSCRSSEFQPKNNCAENVSRIEGLEDENTQAERAETSGDETSTVISEVEAEFGSPTSMLEEDRLLSMERSESATPVSNIEYSSLSKNKSFKDKLPKKQSSESPIDEQHFKNTKTDLSSFDRHENESSDIIQDSLKDLPNEEEPTISNADVMENVTLETTYFDTSLLPKEKCEADVERESEMNSIEEEDEISSPSIEPLQDESKDNEVENESSPLRNDQNVINKKSIVLLSHDEQQGNDNATQEVKDLNLKQPMYTESFDLIENKDKDQVNEPTRNAATDSGKPVEPNSFHTILQKTDTLIKISKFKGESEEPRSDIAPECSESNITSNKKSDLAGEELSAAEALLLIPNQSSSLLEKPHELPPNAVSSSSVNDPTTSVQKNHIKNEEKVENNETVVQETFRKKRRSHMKITPRKRVTETKELDKIDTDYHRGAKIPKVEDHDAKPLSSSLLAKEEIHKKTFAEQYEESFVLKYVKEQPIGGQDKSEALKKTANKTSQSVGKQMPEKVHISVDVSNPLSSQIANILGPNRPSVTEMNTRSGAKKRKQTLEDDIPSFIIKRPSPKNSAEAEAADRDTIAQIQNLCPHVEITRKTSRDDQSMLTSSGSQSVKPQIINQQIIRAGNNHNQPIITVTAKSKRSEDGVFDISNMPIVLSNESVLNDNLHLVITPTSNPDVLRKYHNQPQLIVGSTNNTEVPVSNTKSGVQFRGSSNVKITRTTSRHEQQEVAATEHHKQELINQDNRQTLQQQYYQQHKQLQQQAQQQEQKSVQHFFKRQNKPRQLHQTQPQQQHYQQQFQMHHQNQVQQQLQDEQRLFLQQHQQELFLQQQQLQAPPDQHIQQQVVSSEKVTQTNSDKQIGVDTRGNKYVIIKAPPNTVLQRVQQQQPEPNNAIPQRKLRHSISKTNTNTQCSESNLSPTPHMSLVPIQSQMTQQEIQINPIQCTAIHTNEQPKTTSNTSVLPPTTAKSKQGRGRRNRQSNQMEEGLSVANETTSKIATKTSANSKRSATANVYEHSTRQRTTRSSTANKRKSPIVTSSDTQHSTSRDSSAIPTSSYTPSQQETHSILYMPNPNSSPPNICTNATSPQMQSQQFDQHFTRNPLEAPEGSSGGFAVPSLPVPGYPQTYLLCELIDKKYRELSSKPMYLSEDRTKLLEVPDEVLTDAHRRLTDSQREPNPDVLQVISGTASNMIQPRIIEIDTKAMVVDQLQHDQTQISFGKNMKSNEFTVSEHGSSLLCLQDQQIVQEHLVQDHLVQKQFSQDHLTSEQIVSDQLVQEQFVPEQFVQEQFVQEQFVQEQFVQEQFVQEQLGQEQLGHEQLGQDQFVQEHLVHGQFIQGNILHHQSVLGTDGQNLDPDSAIEESVDSSGQTVILNVGEQQIILDGNAFVNIVNSNNIEVMSDGENNTFTIPAHAIQQLLNSFNNMQNITADGQFESEVCDQQQIEMDESMLQNANADGNVLTVALDDPSLYSDEQFIDSGQILQIETAEGLRLIGTATGNAGIVLRSMMTPMAAKTSETSVLLNQAPKMSAIEMPSDKSKTKFDADPAATATLEDCLNVIGVPAQSSSVPASLELPASVTNPAITVKARPSTPGSIAMNEIISTGLCHHPDISSLPPIDSSGQELHYEFFPSNADTHDKAIANEESVVSDIGEYVVASSCGNFDEPGR